MHHRKGSCLYAKDYFYGLVGFSKKKKKKFYGLVDDNILIIIEFDLIISFIWEKKKKEKKKRERPIRLRCTSFSHEATNNAKKNVISYYI